MGGRVLILRPEPAASATARRARALGLEPVVMPLFTVRPLEWEAPEGSFEALLLTSANAARHGGAQLQRFTYLPCYVIGQATAEAARAAGFDQVVTGPSDGAAAIRMMAEAGVGSALHLCGRDHLPLSDPQIDIERRLVYASEEAESFPEPASDALVLLHSPRAAARFSALLEDRSPFRLAAISASAAEAAGAGWGELHVAAYPRDEALLELAAKLCQTEDDENGS